MRTGEAVREWKKFLSLFACLSLSVNCRNCFHFIKCILVVCPAVLLNQGAITTQQLPAFMRRGCKREKEREEIYHNGFDWVWECVSFAMPIEMLLFHWIVKTIPKLVCCFTFLCVDFSFSLFFFSSNDEGTWVYRWSTFDGQIIKIIIFVYSFFFLQNLRTLWTYDFIIHSELLVWLYGVHRRIVVAGVNFSVQVVQFYLSNNYGANLIWSGVIRLN